jgi:hypothetical protein
MKSYVMGGRFERIATDIARPYPTTKNNNKYVLVIGDYFTKLTEVYPRPDMTAETVTHILVRALRVSERNP